MSVESSDNKARDKALDPSLSFIIQAPAGSGKTTLLAQRLLTLLSCAAAVPEACLAITFTRKAAAEMRDRILLALERAVEPLVPDDPHERKTWELARAVLKRDQQLGWELMKYPNRLKIQTIDAFCAGITRRMPVVSHFGLSPQIVEDPMPLYRSAARQILNSLSDKVPWSSALRMLLVHLDNNLSQAERLLAEMLSHRDQWLPYVGQSLAEERSRARLEVGLAQVIESKISALQASLPVEETELFECAVFAAQQLERMQKDSLIRQCQTVFDHATHNHIQSLPGWLALAELLLREDHQWRQTVTLHQGFPAPTGTKDRAEKEYYQLMKERMCNLLKRLNQYPIFRENLQEIRECPPPRYDEKQWQIVESLVQLLPILTAELLLVFQEQGKVDFIEVTLAALKALGDEDIPSDLALELDYKVQHILVDEFQDTSVAQFRLLEKLTAGWQANEDRTLFLVGDPMQSIYRFRQAEVGLFIRAKRQGVGAIALTPLTLTANFRSDPKIVQWVNFTFQQKFPLHDDGMTGAVTFSASEARCQSKPQAKAEVYDVPLEKEAEIVTEIIQTVQAEDPEGSIALLVRARSHLVEILPVLRQAGIEYQGVQLEHLIDRPIVQDLLTLARALGHLSDRIAWLALLRAPWSQLSLQDIWMIANVEPALPIWFVLQSHWEQLPLSASGKAALGKMVPVIAKALLDAGRVSLRQWVQGTWESLGGLQCLDSPMAIQDAEAFFVILDEISEQDFFEVGGLEQKIQALYSENQSSDSNALQVMTIHKAKGLEFDTVIVPGISRKTRSDPAKLMLWEEGLNEQQGSYFILAPIKAVGTEQDPIYAYLRRQEARRASHEFTRLQYVAATRARKRLYWLVSEQSVSSDGVNV